MAAPRPDALDPLRARVGAHYTRTLATHGPTPLGVDWSCQPTQDMRFVQLLKVCDFAAPFVLNDLGCGYGALVDFLALRHSRARIDYLGIDLATAMVDAARARYGARPRVAFAQGDMPPREADFSVASGIFNVRLDQPPARWRAWVARTLTALHATSRRGFAVNFIAPPPHGARLPAGLYHPAPEVWGEFCLAHLGATVELVEGYGLHEYTLLVRR